MASIPTFHVHVVVLHVAAITHGVRVLPGENGVWDVTRRVREGRALCACGVIPQGAQLPRTGVQGGSPGEKGQVESLTDRLPIGVADAQLRLDEREYLAVRGCPPHTHDGAGRAFYELDLSRPGSSRC